MRMTVLAALAIASPALGQLWDSSGANIFNTNAGSVGIGLNNPSLGKLHIVSNGGFASVYARDFSATGAVRGLWGETASTSGIGAVGVATAPTGAAFGLYGQSFSSTGTGVVALATSTTGRNWGVWSRTASREGVGVFGIATSTEAFTSFGVLGQTNSPIGVAVGAHADAASGVNVALRPHTNSAQGYSLYATGGRNFFQGNLGLGVDQPTAQLHVSGSARLQGLPASTTNTTVVTLDANGIAATRSLARWNTGIPIGVREFTAAGSANFIIPSDVTRIRAYLWGGGGGGTGGNGGGSGAYVQAIIDVTPGETLTVTVGGGGSAGASGGATVVSRPGGGGSPVTIASAGGGGSNGVGGGIGGTITGITRVGFNGCIGCADYNFPPFAGRTPGLVPPLGGALAPQGSGGPPGAAGLIGYAYLEW